MIDADTQRRLMQALGQGLFAGALIGVAHLAQRFIRPRPAQAQAASVTQGDPAQPSAPQAAAEEIPMAGGSWLNRFVFGPIKAEWAALAASTNPQVVAAKNAITAAEQVDLQAVNPIIDAGIVGVESIAANLLSQLGLAGVAADQLIVNPSLQLAGGILKQAIDHALGIAPLPATTPTPTPTGA